MLISQYALFVDLIENVFFDQHKKQTFSNRITLSGGSPACRWKALGSFNYIRSSYLPGRPKKLSLLPDLDMPIHWRVKSNKTSRCTSLGCLTHIKKTVCDKGQLAEAVLSLIGDTETPVMPLSSPDGLRLRRACEEQEELVLWKEKQQQNRLELHRP